MSFVAVAVGGGALLSAGVGMYSANKAAGAQQKAADAATAEQQRQYDLTRGDMKPWMDTGGKAITTLGGMVQPGGDLYKNFSETDWQQDPGYKFRLAEGEKAVGRSAAARGSVLGGGTLKDLTAYDSGLASDEYGKAYARFQTDRNTRFNQLSTVAGGGQIANQTMATVGQNTANNISNNAMYAGNARASGYVGMANAFNGGIKGATDAYMNYQNGTYD